MFDSVQSRDFILSSTGVSAGGLWVGVYTARPEQTSEGRTPQTNLLFKHVCYFWSLDG